MKKLKILVAALLISQSDLFAQEGIVGGDIAGAEEYPWMCTIVVDAPLPGCGASLIKPQWVLTAGHCSLIPVDITHVLINSLAWNPDAMGDYSELIEIEEMIVHEDFGPPSGGVDLALIRLAVPTEIAPVELATMEESEFFEHGDPATVLGWGLTDAGATMPSTLLRKADCKFFGYEECEELYDAVGGGLFDANPDGSICAGYFVGEDVAGAAAGDSGGPLFYTDGAGIPKLVGVTSGGEGPVTTEEFPGIFTLVPEYLDWIETTIADYELALSLEKENRELLTISYTDNGIVVNGLKADSEYDISVYDMAGNLIQTESQFTGNQMSLLTQAYNSGIYMLRVVNLNGGHLTVEKFMVR